MKKIIKCVCLIVAVLSLSGCGEETPASNETENEVVNVNEQKIISELTEYDWINLYRGVFIYEFDEDGTFQIYNYGKNTDSPEEIQFEVNDSWVPAAENLEVIPYLEGTWKIKEGNILIKNATEKKNIQTEMYFKNEEGYEKYNTEDYEGNAFLYESSYEAPEDEFEASTSTAFRLFRVGKKEDKSEKAELPLNGLRGVYVYDDENEGEVLVVHASDDTTVTGQRIYKDDNGEYGTIDFTWEIMEDDTFLARELFENGKDYVYYKAGENELIADYPEAWWPDKHFEYKGAPEELESIVGSGEE